MNIRNSFFILLNLFGFLTKAQEIKPIYSFNRSLILSPQIYGNPWFLHDNNEYPKLGRIYNLARKYGSIMLNGLVLHEEKYGEEAVSRGSSDTRLISGPPESVYYKI